MASFLLILLLTALQLNITYRVCCLNRSMATVRTNPLTAALLHLYIYIYVYLLQLGSYPVTVVILHVNET